MYRVRVKEAKQVGQAKRVLESCFHAKKKRKEYNDDPNEEVNILRSFIALTWFAW